MVGGMKFLSPTLPGAVLFFAGLARAATRTPAQPGSHDHLDSRGKVPTAQGRQLVKTRIQRQEVMRMEMVNPSPILVPTSARDSEASITLHRRDEAIVILETVQGLPSLSLAVSHAVSSLNLGKRQSPWKGEKGGHHESGQDSTILDCFFLVHLFTGDGLRRRSFSHS